MNQKQNEKLKTILKELIAVNFAGTPNNKKYQKLLDEAFEPEIMVEQKQCKANEFTECTCKEPSKQETGENKTREQKQHESNIAVENNKAGFFFGYQKGREDRTAEIQGYLNQPGLEEESAFFKELLKNV